MAAIKVARLLDILDYTLDKKNKSWLYAEIGRS